MAKQIIEVEILAVLKDATKSVKDFAKQTQKDLDGINFKTAVSAISDAFNIIEKTAGRAFNAIQDNVTEFVNAAAKQEEAINKLNTSLALAGTYSFEASQGIQDFARGIQETTTVSDEAVLGLVALSRNFTKTNNEAQRLTEAAIELSAATGLSLEGSVKNLGKSFGGLTGELGESLPIIKTLTVEQLKAGAAVDLILSRFGGAAAGQVDTFNGAVAQLSNTFNGFKETIGSFFTNNPAVIAGIQEIQKGIVKLSKELRESGSGIQSLITEGFVSLVEIAPAVVSTMQRITDNLNAIGFYARKAGAILGGFAAAFLETDVGNQMAIGEQVREDLEALDVAFGKSLNASEEFFGPLINNAKEVAKNVRKAAEEAKKIGREFKNSASGGGGGSIFSADEIRKSIEDAVKNPFTIVFDAELKKEMNLGLNKQDSQLAGAIAGGLSSVLKGGAGAQDLFKGLASAAADALVPGLGAVAGEIVGVLSQGPEKVRQMIQEFVKAVPDIIEGIILSIPVLIEELAKAIPEIIDRLAEKAPEIIQALVAAIPDVVVALQLQMPKIAVALIEGIIKGIPDIVKGFAEEFLKIPARFAEELLDAINPFGGGGDGGGGFLSGIPIVGDIFGGIGDFLGLAAGGTIPDVPQYAGDRFGPVMLDGGEEVLDKSTATMLREYLAGQGGGTTTVIFQIGQQELARANLNLSRGGFRTS